ncbi:ankyrin repeat-containing domain protein [Xylariales sp. PMI_506]|nr:ankyrin repeat-containing domain protein [Xylariales sp. PMI_506]
MSTLPTLPQELLEAICEWLLECDISCLVRSNRKLYHILNDYLYRHNAKVSQCSALLWGAKVGLNITALKALQNGAYINIRNGWGNTPLHLAVENGHFSLVQQLLERDNINVNVINPNFQTALHHAAYFGYMNIIEILLNVPGIKLNLQDCTGMTPLMWAVQRGHLDIVKCFLEQNDIEVNAVDAFLLTPLAWSAKFGLQDMVQLLLGYNDIDTEVESMDYETGRNSPTAVDVPNSLVAALESQHAVIEAFNPAAASNQGLIIQACIAAGVKHLITPDFSSDTFNPYVNELMIFEPKRQAQLALEEAVGSSAGAISWTAIIVGAWYDWAVENGQFWIDKESRTVTRFGSGNQKTSISRLELCGEAAVAILRTPEKYRNRPAYFHSHSVSTNELIALLEEIDGGWKVADITLDGFVDKARALWHEDTKNNVKDRLNSTAYRMLGTSALFDEANRYHADFTELLEPGWDEGRDALKENLKRLLN